MSELEELPSWAGRSSRDARFASPETPAEAAEAPTEAVEAAEAPADLTAGTPLAKRPPAKPVVNPPGPTEHAGEFPAEPVAEVTPPGVEHEIRPMIAAQSVGQPMVDQVPTDEPLTQPAATAAVTVPVDTSVPVDASVPVVTGAGPEHEGKGVIKKLLFGLVALAVLAGAGYGGYLLAGAQDDGDTTTTADPASPSTGDAGTTTDDAGDGDQTADGTATGEGAGPATTVGGSGEDTEDVDADGETTQTVTVDVVDDDTAEGDAAAATDDNGETPMNDGNRQAFFRGGKVYLTGAVPSEEIGELIVSKAAAVVGPDNVVNEYTIDPSVTIDPGSSAPLYVEDVILFEFNSVEIAQPFLPILDLGTLLLRQNPQASVTVVTRTDAVGSEETNLEVARRRAQAIINYWIGQGVNADQIHTDPRGEEGASEDDDPETAAKQRRAEFIITGLLD